MEVSSGRAVAQQSPIAGYYIRSEAVLHLGLGIEASEQVNKIQATK